MKHKMTILAVMAAVALAGWNAVAFNNPHITELDLSIDGVLDNLEYFEPDPGTPSPTPMTPNPPKGPGGFVCSNGWKKITLKATGMNDPMKTRLNLCSDKIEVWTATNGGTQVICPKDYDNDPLTPAPAMPSALWVKGVKVSDYGPGKDASGNWTNCGPEHITLEAINNGELPDIPGTYYDHIAFTVFTADYALDHVCTTAVHTATHDVLVTLKPSPLGSEIRLELKRASGASGSAIFVGGNSITNISETKTLTVLGTQASDPISNMLMEASLDACAFTSDVFTVVDVVKETGTEVLHTVNTTNDTTQVDDTNTAWICQTATDRATLKLELDWKPTTYAGTEFHWDAILPDGTAASEWGTPGTFVNNPTNITWKPGNPTNREFKIRTWFDCAAPSAYDATEPYRIIDVKVVDFVKLMLTNSATGKRVVDETRVDEPPTANNTLYLGETTNGTAKMAIQGWWLPEGVNSNWFRCKILLTNETDTGTTQWKPNDTTFATNSVTVTWTNTLDTNGQTNRAFKVRGWYDCDHDGEYDTDEPHRLLYVNVLRVDLDVDGLSETDEDTVGGLVVRNHDGNNAPRKKITIHKVDPNAWSENVMLTRTATKAKVFTASSGGSEITFNGTDNKFANSALPKDLYVEGNEQSALMRDIQIKAEAEGVSGCEDPVSFTVLWVDMAAGKHSGTMSSDNAATNSYYSFYTVNPNRLDLGPGEFSDRFGRSTEFRGDVFPTNFVPSEFGMTMNLSRTKDVFSYYSNPSTNGSDVYYHSTGDDTGPTSARDDDPQSGGSAGKIYDFDNPGISKNQPGDAVGHIRRYRGNFHEFANAVIGGVTTRCSGTMDWYSKQSWQKGTNTWSQINDVANDNANGDGQLTSQTWNMQ